MATRAPAAGAVLHVSLRRRGTRGGGGHAAHPSVCALPSPLLAPRALVPRPALLEPALSVGPGEGACEQPLGGRGGGPRSCSGDEDGGGRGIGAEEEDDDHALDEDAVEGGCEALFARGPLTRQAAAPLEEGGALAEASERLPGAPPPAQRAPPPWHARVALEAGVPRPGSRECKQVDAQQEGARHEAPRVVTHRRPERLARFEDFVDLGAVDEVDVHLALLARAAAPARGQGAHRVHHGGEVGEVSAGAHELVQRGARVRGRGDHLAAFVRPGAE
mmetsp:Transcript_6864/g.18577  ORF Transcript_6864/g.18577 Transcript_6864/m.18577 type:complete len:276 (-) Transcript_6864:1049-1876(-)